MAYTVTNLTNGVGYQFQVRALNVLGTGTIAASFTVAATPVTPLAADESECSDGLDSPGHKFVSYWYLGSYPSAGEAWLRRK